MTENELVYLLNQHCFAISTRLEGGSPSGWRCRGSGCGEPLPGLGLEMDGYLMMIRRHQAKKILERLAELEK